MGTKAGSVVAFSAFATTCAMGLSLALAQSPPPPGRATDSAITRNLAEARSGNYVMEHEHSRVVWNISHHGYSTFSALFSDVHGTLKLDAADPTRSELTATVNMDSVGTLLPDFDGRLKGANFFNTAKYPTATFKSGKIQRTSANGLRVSGELTFLGMTKPAILEANFNQAGSGLGPGGYRLGFDGRMVIKRTDFGMAPSTLGDEVTLQIEVEFHEAEAAK